MTNQSKPRTTPGRGRRGDNPQVDEDTERALARAVLDEGKSLMEASEAIGLKSDMVARFAVAREQGRREVEPEVLREMLSSMTAQEKFDTALRQHQRKLDAAFDQRVADNVRRRIDEIVLPHWKQRLEDAERVMNRRRGIMDKALFNAIRRALHPDSRSAVSDKKLAEAFDAFMGLEKLLLDEKDSPTGFDGIPSSLEEWDRMRVKRSTRRAAPANIARRQ
jgi:hypothetical protein